jgi:ornithine cyclodeaminase
VLIDGGAVTAVRTGAASGVATDLLARPDARVLAIVGTGGQAADQVDAVCAVRPIEEIRVASRTQASREAFARKLAEQRPGVRVEAAPSARAAVEGADVICCATNATEPLFSRADVGDDVHVNAIGAFTLSMCELGADLLADARVLAVDQVEAALEEAGDLVRAIEAGAIATESLQELGTLLAAGRPVEQGGLTVFKSVGIAAQDWAVTTLARERAAGLPGLQSLELSVLQA